VGLRINDPAGLKHVGGLLKKSGCLLKAVHFSWFF